MRAVLKTRSVSQGVKFEAVSAPLLERTSGGESMKLHRMLLTALTALGAALVPVQAAQAGEADAFFTHYYDVATSTSPSASGYGGHGASGGIGDGLLRIVNSSDFAPQQRGTVCAMIYVFDDIEEMQACCGCPVTPDGLRTMSVINNVTKNFGVNRGNLNAGVIDIIASTPNLKPGKAPLPPQITPLGSSGFACDPTFQFGPTIGTTDQPLGVVPGLRAWITNTEGNAPVPAASNLIRGTSASEFEFSPLDAAHFAELENFCFFLVTNGSGTGACSCGSGDSFSKAPLPTD